jgi:serine/threonine-protein kinase
MIPTGDRPRVTLDDPPMIVSGMTTVVLDPEGRLVRFAAIPPQVDPPSPHSGVGGSVDWKILFDAMGLDMATFTSVEPEWTPAHYADTRVAWKGPMPQVAGQELRIEAGAYRGKPIYLQQVTAWTTPTRMPATIAERSQLRWFAVVVQLVVLAIFIAAALIARHNLRNGRGDRKGAFRLAGVILLAALGVWALDSKHVADPNVEMTRFFTGQPLWAAGILWLLYLALEPYVRRFWPTTLVSWSRMMSGQWRDPLLGRDVLFGIALGALINVAALASIYLSMRLGYARTPPLPDLRMLLGTDIVIARALGHVFEAVLNALFAVFGMVLLKMIFKRERLAVGFAIGLTLLVAMRGIFDGGAPLINGIVVLLIVTTVVFTIQKLGLVATVMLFLTNEMMSSAAVTLDSSRWFFGNSVLIVAIPVALACYAFYVSRGGEPLLGRRLLD